MTVDTHTVRNVVQYFHHNKPLQRTSDPALATNHTGSIHHQHRNASSERAVKLAYLVSYTLPVGMAEARVYQRKDNSRPFDERFQSVRDARAAARIATAIAKLERGLRADVRSVGDGVQEARIDYGPGYRVYFGIDGISLLILLLCGDKRTQADDIQFVQALWTEYRRRKAMSKPGSEGLLKQAGRRCL